MSELGHGRLVRLVGDLWDRGVFECRMATDEVQQRLVAARAI